MKVNANLIFGFLIVVATILVANLIEGKSQDQEDDKRISDVHEAMKMDPREGRIWAPWTYAGPVTRGRWNVGGYGSSRYAPNVAWDSTMSRRSRRSRRHYNRRRY